MRLLDRQPNDRDRQTAEPDLPGGQRQRRHRQREMHGQHGAEASAHAMPGNFSTLASIPLPPIRTAMPASATVSATARSGDSRSPRIGHARNATQTGIEMPSTAAS